MLKDSKGYAIVEGFLLIVILVLLVGTVLFVYKSNKTTSENLERLGNGTVEVKKNDPLSFYLSN